MESGVVNGPLTWHSAANFRDSSVLTSSRKGTAGYVARIRKVEMETIDREVVSVLLFQQWLEATEHAHWDEAAMALYKLQAIEHGETFKDLTIHETGSDTAIGELKAA